MRTILLLVSALWLTPALAAAQARLTFGPPHALAAPAGWTPGGRGAPVRFSADGQRVALTGWNGDGSLRVIEYTLADGRPAGEHREPDPLLTSPDPRVRLQPTPQHDGAGCRVDLVEGTTAPRTLGTYATPCSTLLDIAMPSFSDDGTRLLLAGAPEGAPAGTQVTVFDTRTGSVVARSSYAEGGGGADPAVQITPRGDGLQWIHGRTGVELLRLGSDAVVYRGPTQTDISPTLRWALERPGCPFSVDTCRTRAVLRAIGGRAAYTLGTAPAESHSSAAFSPDGTLLALALQDTLSLWSLGAGAPRRLATTRLAGARSLWFDPRGHAVAAVTEAGLTVLPLVAAH